MTRPARRHSARAIAKTSAIVRIPLVDEQAAAFPSQRNLHLPITLPDDFPIREGMPSHQRDQMVSYLHAHDCLMIGHCRAGAGVFAVDQKLLHFQTGDTVVVAPMQFHMLRHTSGTIGHWSWLYLDPLRLVTRPKQDGEMLTTARLADERFNNLITPREDPTIALLVQQITTELHEQRRGFQVCVRGLVTSLMVRLHRRAPAGPVRPVSKIETAMRRIAPVLDLMADHFSATADMRLWAQSCHVSVTQFRRLFRNALGTSPYTYLTELRVRMAANRLHVGGDRVIAIAMDSGFPTLSSFNRAFRRVMGMTPRAWRAQK